MPPSAPSQTLPSAGGVLVDLADILSLSLISCGFQNYDNTALLVSEFNPILVANYIEVGRHFCRIATDAEGGRSRLVWVERVGSV